MAHDAEATASEKFHKQEGDLKAGPGKFKGLAKFFDKRHRESYSRQHDLRRHMQKLGGVVKTNLGDTSYMTSRDLKSPDDFQKLFTDTANTLGGLYDRHAAVYEAAEKAGDRETCEKFHGVHHELACQERKARRKAKLVSDLGLGEFLAKHV